MVEVIWIHALTIRLNLDVERNNEGCGHHNCSFDNERVQFVSLSCPIWVT